MLWIRTPPRRPISWPIPDRPNIPLLILRTAKFSTSLMEISVGPSGATFNATKASSGPLIFSPFSSFNTQLSFLDSSRRKVWIETVLKSSPSKKSVVLGVSFSVLRHSFQANFAQTQIPPWRWTPYRTWDLLFPLAVEILKWRPRVVGKNVHFWCFLSLMRGSYWPSRCVEWSYPHLRGSFAHSCLRKS